MKLCFFVFFFTALVYPQNVDTIYVVSNEYLKFQENCPSPLYLNALHRFNMDCTLSNESNREGSNITSKFMIDSKSIGLNKTVPEANSFLAYFDSIHFSVLGLNVIKITYRSSREPSGALSIARDKEYFFCVEPPHLIDELKSRDSILLGENVILNFSTYEYISPERYTYTIKLGDDEIIPDKNSFFLS